MCEHPKKNGSYWTKKKHGRITFGYCECYTDRNNCRISTPLTPFPCHSFFACDFFLFKISFSDPNCFDVQLAIVFFLSWPSLSLLLFILQLIWKCSIDVIIWYTNSWMKIARKMDYWGVLVVSLFISFHLTIVSCMKFDCSNRSYHWNARRRSFAFACFMWSFWFYMIIAGMRISRNCTPRKISIWSGRKMKIGAIYNIRAIII